MSRTFFAILYIFPLCWLCSSPAAHGPRALDDRWTYPAEMQEQYMRRLKSESSNVADWLPRSVLYVLSLVLAGVARDDRPLPTLLPLDLNSRRASACVCACLFIWLRQSAIA